ncbi:Hypothetical protein NTJ_05528 [Nesidiocoris tenuis]|uniref:Uncharacterized protein n=1 Tax=Nesidiocoris tenuis TaxID=355587 RepID=A0ABN7AMR5_9HEMI|nr:Hypothetical protein NTJ_05528 [Nesidiocoris tenuis]
MCPMLGKEMEESETEQFLLACFIAAKIQAKGHSPYLLSNIKKKLFSMLMTVGRACGALVKITKVQPFHVQSKRYMRSTTLLSRKTFCRRFTG